LLIIDLHCYILVLGTHTKKPQDKKKKGTDTADPNAQAQTMEVQPLTSPPSMKFKIHKNSIFHGNGELSNTPNDTFDGPYVEDDQEELMTFVLTEDIFVEILSIRLQVRTFTDSIRWK
jgi:hypothetical protein